MKSRLALVLFLLLVIAATLYGFRDSLGLFGQNQEVKKHPKIKIKAKEPEDKTFMLSQGADFHVHTFYDDCTTGKLDEAYDLLPASFRQKVTRQEFIADFQNNLVTKYLLLSEREGNEMLSLTISYSRQDGSNWTAEWLFERPEYDWLATKISVTQM